MSDDGTHIIRRDGVDQFFYVRWGGSYIDRDLLCGPKAFLEFVRGLTRTPAPFLEGWLSGVTFIDCDRQMLWYWSSQFVGSDALCQRLFIPLIAQTWPGWTLRWMYNPAATLAVLLPEHPLPSPHPPLPYDFSDLQSEAWDEALEDGSWAEVIEALDEKTVRGWVEKDTHRSVVCLVSETGVEERVINDGYSCGALLGTGPAALAVLSALPSRPIGEGPSESWLSSAYWIDPSRRHLEYWHALPDSHDHPIHVLPDRWPGWTAAHLDGGPSTLMRRLERDPRTLMDTDVQKRLRGELDRLLGPRPTGAQILARAVDDIETAPGEQIVVTPPGPGNRGPDLWPQGRLWPRAEEMLAQLAFQPLAAPSDEPVGEGD